MEKERLLRLADYVESIPPDLFDMDRWVNETGLPPCQTVGCVAGHALVSGQMYGFTILPKLRDHCLDEKTGESWLMGEAFAESFGLSRIEATAITAPSAYPLFHVSQNKVAERIRDIVKGVKF